MHFMCAISSRKYTALFVAALFLAGPQAFSQSSANQSQQNLTYDQAVQQATSAEQQYADGYATVGYSPAILTIPNRPFTANRVYREWTRKGNPRNPVLSTTVTIARDNVGRIHYESSRSAGNVTVMISDPIQHLNYQYEIDPSDPNNQTATSCTQPTMAQITQPNPAPASPTISASAAAPVSPPALPTSSKKDLGSQQMEGTIGYGQARIDYLDLQPGTLTMAATSWFSPDLGLNLTQLSDYSNQNPFSIHTRNVVLGDPDPSLFQLPSGYTLTGSTTSCIPTIN